MVNVVLFPTWNTLLHKKKMTLRSRILLSTRTGQTLITGRQYVDIENRWLGMTDKTVKGKFKINCRHR